MSRPRLLPWSEDGKPAYLHTDDPHSVLSQLADQMEETQLSVGDDVLEGARDVLNDPEAGAPELRFAATRLSECLCDALRVARSRGTRLEDYENRADEHEHEDKDEEADGDTTAQENDA
ncbi:hypothetical protein ACFOOM_22650 [Streptomyces echinoruber]|uniref:Uncharacterized protein n=1 Tax=Streptomyces echinoruber TaxID=68898 RepID=A0A918R482_9ACTN|nr:hypothetical protein [Streptomyces echinoruber]GGZ82601.1 hypothetical protein GCM10010389_20730 [Streptomyces echinoruber]